MMSFFKLNKYLTLFKKKNYIFKSSRVFLYSREEKLHFKMHKIKKDLIIFIKCSALLSVKKDIHTVYNQEKQTIIVTYVINM